MKTILHQDRNLFVSLLQAASEYLKIPLLLIEKDYYISLILRKLSESAYREQIVFKGGTSLSKGYHLIHRFSEDIDFAVINIDMTRNQVKMLLSKLMKEITVGFAEDTAFADMSKGSMFRKQAFGYISSIGNSEYNLGNPIPSRIIVEISSFANPFPYEQRVIEPMVTTFLKEKELTQYVEDYKLTEFLLNVLSLRQTLCEKLVSLIRFSMSEDPIATLSGKIRHFYDIHALLEEEEIRLYTQQNAFLLDIQRLIQHDQQIFTTPPQWQQLKSLKESPLLANFETIWKQLHNVYIQNLSIIAYREIPKPDEIATTLNTLISTLAHVLIND